MHPSTISNLTGQSQVGSKWKLRVVALTSRLKAMALDAPLIAVLWTELLRREFADSSASSRQPSAFQVNLVVFAVVWLVYMLDRWLDSRVLDFGKPVSKRHRFVRQHAHQLKPLWCIVAVFISVFACWNLEHWRVGWGIAHLTLVGFYFVAIHRHRSAGQWIPKEVVVGWMFAMGTAIAASPAHPSASRLMPGVIPEGIWLVAILFVFNCMIVANQQLIVDRCQGTPSVVGRAPWIRRHLSRLGAGLTFTVLACPLVIPISPLLWISILVSCAISTWLCSPTTNREVDWCESANSIPTHSTCSRIEFADATLIVVPLFFLSVQGLLSNWKVAEHVF